MRSALSRYARAESALLILVYRCAAMILVFMSAGAEVARRSYFGYYGGGVITHHIGAYLA